MEKALSHGKVVEIVERSGSLTRIMPDGGDIYDAVWIKTASLKPVPKPRVPKGHVEVASLLPAPLLMTEEEKQECRLDVLDDEAKITDDIVVPTAGVAKKPVIAAKTDYAHFLPEWLINPKLRLHTRVATFDKAIDEYATWTDGETFPEQNVCAVRETEVKKYTWSPFHEWKLQFKYDAGVSYPFPIVPSGQGGGLALGEPAGILTGNTVRVSFKSIIEPLVRNGLRA